MTMNDISASQDATDTDGFHKHHAERRAYREADMISYLSALYTASPYINYNAVSQESYVSEYVCEL